MELGSDRQAVFSIDNSYGSASLVPGHLAAQVRPSVCPLGLGFCHKKDGTMYKTKIGDDGRAILERHYTSAPNPKYHSNPHDHMIDWHTPREGIPNFGPPFNYWDGETPEFKSYSWSNAMKSIIYDTNTPEDIRFKTISEFKECILRGGEVVFSWNSKQYGVFKSSTQYCIALFNGEEEKWYSSPEELLEHIVDGDRLRDVITQVTVWDRTI